MGRGKKIDDVAVVVDAAIKLIEEGGIEEFSTRRLAAALHISAMTLYNYFTDREAILKKVAIRCLNEFTAETEGEIGAARARGEAANPVQALRLLARRLFELGMARPKLYLFLFDSSMGGVREDPEVSREYGYFAQAAAGALRDGSLSEELRKDALLFELLANSLVVGSIRWPGSIDRGSCLALVDRAYERILARYESLVAEASAG
ncbi:MAG TPA: TetR/AcrR family transcriptional regulator [Spirochaetia bacterium]|nr:TetR/AcrR family transcriptional regulator [Spirochaetia bacterium]